MTPPAQLYPRWYVSLSSSVSGLTAGFVIATFFYETNVWHTGDFWQLRSMPLLVTFIPAVFLSLFEIFFRTRRHLRLQRQMADAQIAR